MVQKLAFFFLSNKQSSKKYQHLTYINPMPCSDKSPPIIHHHCTVSIHSVLPLYPAPFSVHGLSVPATIPHLITPPSFPLPINLHETRQRVHHNSKISHSLRPTNNGIVLLPAQDSSPLPHHASLQCPWIPVCHIHATKRAACGQQQPSHLQSSSHPWAKQLGFILSFHKSLSVPAAALQLPGCLLDTRWERGAGNASSLNSRLSLQDSSSHQSPFQMFMSMNGVPSPECVPSLSFLLASLSPVQPKRVCKHLHLKGPLTFEHESFFVSGCDSSGWGSSLLCSAQKVV